MVTVNSDPEAGGNVAQPDDGRDASGRLPEPLDAAHWPPTDDADSPAIIIPGMPASQPAGTGPVVSTPVDTQDAIDDTDYVEHRDDSAAAQGGPNVEHDISGTPVAGNPDAAPPSQGLRSDNTPSRTSGVMKAQAPAKATPAKATAGSKSEADAKATNAKADNPTSSK